MRRITLTATAALVAGLLGTARADEEKVEIEKLPAAVRGAIKGRFRKAEIKSASKEEEDGETIFEVSLTSEGDKYDVAVEDDGEIKEIERAILVDALPSAVTKAIKTKYPEGKLRSAERIEKGEVVA